MPQPRASADDEKMMRIACRLARKGAGRTSPNPPVGAVLVKRGRLIARGYHRFAGSDHAEIVALKQAGEAARGASLYITLEPCSHHGRTPPCAEALIRAGIREVVCGTGDPNPLVSGRGFRQLKRAGIKVRVGVLEQDCRTLIEAFSKFITRRLPFVTLKLAATLDGRIAAHTGDARWISGERSRLHVHRLRNEVDAVIVGVDTVIADDPELTCRIPAGRNPRRLVLDRSLRIPLAAKLLHLPDLEKTIVAAGPDVPAARVRKIEALGARVWQLPLQERGVAWRPLLRKLAADGIVSVMIEGGAAIAASACQEKIVDKIVFFYAPKILGGDAIPMIGALGRRRVSQAILVKDVQCARSGEDFMITARL